MYTEKQYQNIENQMIEDIGLIQKSNGLKPNRTSAEKTHQTLLMPPRIMIQDAKKKVLVVMLKLLLWMRCNLCSNI